MIKIYSTDENNKINLIDTPEVIDKNFDLTYKWINLINPTDKEIENVEEITGIEAEDIKAALDEEERARIQKQDDLLLTIFDVPILEEEEGNYYSYTTLPIGFLMKEKYVVTVSIKENSLLRDFENGRIKGIDLQKRNRFLLQLLYYNSKKYSTYLKQINRASQRIQNELHKSTKNKELIQLLDLENSLVYFRTSLAANSTLVIDNIKNTNNYIKKYEEDIELINDVDIESQQAIEMCKIYIEILAGTMDAFASVISNNQNIVVKKLTIITIMMAIPNIFAGFFGMNVKGIPDSRYAFWIVIAISLAVAAIVGVILFRKK